MVIQIVDVISKIISVGALKFMYRHLLGKDNRRIYELHAMGKLPKSVILIVIWEDYPTIGYCTCQ